MSDRKTANGSIVRRLLLTSILILPLFFGITGYAIDQSHNRSLLAAEQSQLQLQFYGILGVMEWQNTEPMNVERLREPRFWQFRSGLYAFIHSSDGTLQWQSTSANSMEFLREAFAVTKPGKEVFDEYSAKGDNYFRFRYHVIWEDENGIEYPLIFTLLENEDAYKTEVSSFRRNLIISLGLASVLLLAAQILMLKWGLSPLARMAKELQLLESGTRENLGNDYPKELTGITHNLNSLLKKEQLQRERYRNTLGDLAHSLKTPLSVMHTSEAATKDPMVSEQLEKMGNIIAYQLQRAVSTGPRQLGNKTDLGTTIKRLLNSLDKVYRDKALKLSLHCPDGTMVAIDEQDLIELLGNLLDNACKAAKDQVRVSATIEQPGQSIQLAIEDDGPGFPKDTARLFMERGHRGDQYGSGQGLGLSVVADIANSYSARLEVADSELGGAKITISLPA